MTRAQTQRKSRLRGGRVRAAPHAAGASMLGRPVGSGPGQQTRVPAGDRTGGPGCDRQRMSRMIARDILNRLGGLWDFGT